MSARRIVDPHITNVFQLCSYRRGLYLAMQPARHTDQEVASC